MNAALMLKAVSLDEVIRRGLRVDRKLSQAVIFDRTNTFAVFNVVDGVTDKVIAGPFQPPVPYSLLLNSGD